MAPIQPRIRPYENRDAAAVVGLSLRAWAPVFPSIERSLGSAIYEQLYPNGWRESQRQAVEAVLTAEEKRVWVAEAEADAVGFVAVEIHPESNMGEIYMLAVDPDYQGGGLGSALTEFALARIKEAGMKVAMVETGSDPGHAAARRTYEKAGYLHVPVARYFKEL